jgi:lipoate-protein ligase B
MARGVREYVRLLEQVLVNLLASYRIKGSRVAGAGWSG